MMIEHEQFSQIKQKSSMLHSKASQNPSLIGGYSLLYDNRVPIDMQYIDYDRAVNHVSSAELVNFKIYTFGMKPNINRIKIQIDSENDPFFISKTQCEEISFSVLKNTQKLNIEFQQLPTIIIKCLNKIEEAKGKLNASLLIYSDGKSKLCLTYTSEFKNIEILSLDLNQQNDEQLEEIIKYKYKELRKKIMIAEERLLKISEVIRQKNPSLLQQIHKSK